MSQFVGYKRNCYIYNREDQEYSIDKNLLNSIFKTHGYCCDPATRTGLALTPKNIDELRELARNNGDHVLVATILSLSGRKAPSPRMINDHLLHETIINEKQRYDNLDEDVKRQIQNILRVILNIGLYLGGWKGGNEPYITSLRNIHDIVRIELIIMPLIQSLYKNINYPLIKNFPVMSYYQGGPLSSYASKPSITDNALCFDQCLNTISVGITDNNNQMACHLISTAYYYITAICKIPLPMLEPLIMSLTQ